MTEQEQVLVSALAAAEDAERTARLAHDQAITASRRARADLLACREVRALLCPFCGSPATVVSIYWFCPVCLRGHRALATVPAAKTEGGVS